MCREGTGEEKGARSHGVTLALVLSIQDSSVFMVASNWQHKQTSQGVTLRDESAWTVALLSARARENKRERESGFSEENSGSDLTMAANSNIQTQTRAHLKQEARKMGGKGLGGGGQT